jgi:hypothetical protein
MLKVAEKEEIICSEHDFSKEYFKILYDSETSYYYNLSPSSFKYLLYVYKIGIDFYSRKNAEYAKFLTNKLNSTFRLNLEIEFRLKLLQLKTNINNKLEQMEKPEIKASLEKKLKEESEKKIKKFKKNINSDIIMIRLELRNQRRNFIKNTRNKLFNKFINNNYLIEQNNPIDMKNKININITPIKVFNNDMIHHQLMIRTKGASDNKHCFFPTEIFFDEDKNYLLKNNIGVFQKKEKNYVNNITKAFIEKYSLCYSIIIQQFIKKIIKIFDENYRNKIKLFSQYKETVSLLDEMINDEYYKKDMIKNEIGLHEENINYLKEKEELNMDLNDKLVDIVEKFEINNPIDKNAVNEIVNDYVYEILGLFV